MLNTITVNTIDYLIETFEAEITIEPDTPLEYTSEERRVAYEKMMREM